jgi:hypothetical protein
MLVGNQPTAYLQFKLLLYVEKRRKKTVQRLAVPKSKFRSRIAPVSASRKSLALLLGAIYKQERTDAEIKSPGLSAKAQELLAREPQTYGAAIEMLMDGADAKRTAYACSLELPLVKFIARQHPEIRAARRKIVVGNLEESIVSLSSRLADEADDVPMRDVARTLSVAIDKLAALTGNVTQTIAIQHHASREQVLAMYDEIKRKDDDRSSTNKGLDIPGK